MKLNHVKQRRNGIFSFRIVVPERSRAEFNGKKEIWETLKTRDKELAYIRAAAKYAQYRARFYPETVESDPFSYSQQKQTCATLGFPHHPASEIIAAPLTQALQMLIPKLITFSQTTNPNAAEVGAVLGSAEPTMTLNELFTTFQELSPLKWNDLNRREREKKWNRFRNPVMDFKETVGDIDLLKITHQDAEEYALALSKRVVKGELQISSAVDKLKFLKLVVKKVLDKRFADHPNPFEKVTIDFDRKKLKNKRESFSEDDVKAIRTKFATVPLNDQARNIFEIALNTGAHVKEIAFTTVKDVFVGDDVKIPYIRISENDLRTHLKTGGARHRDLPLIGFALEAAKRAVEAAEGDGPLFPRYGRPGGEDACTQLLNKYIRPVVEKGRTTYCARHRMVDLLRNAKDDNGNKVDSDLLKAIIGHNGGQTADYGSQGYSLALKLEALEAALPEDNR